MRIEYCEKFELSADDFDMNEKHWASDDFAGVKIYDDEKLLCMAGVSIPEQCCEYCWITIDSNVSGFRDDDSSSVQLSDFDDYIPGEPLAKEIINQLNVTIKKNNVLSKKYIDGIIPSIIFALNDSKYIKFYIFNVGGTGYYPHKFFVYMNNNMICGSVNHNDQ